MIPNQTKRFLKIKNKNPPGSLETLNFLKTHDGDMEETEHFQMGEDAENSHESSFELN